MKREPMCPSAPVTTIFFMASVQIVPEPGREVVARSGQAGVQVDPGAPAEHRPDARVADHGVSDLDDLAVLRPRDADDPSAHVPGDRLGDLGNRDLAIAYGEEDLPVARVAPRGREQCG